MGGRTLSSSNLRLLLINIIHLTLFLNLAHLSACSVCSEFYIAGNDMICFVYAEN